MSANLKAGIETLRTGTVGTRKSPYSTPAEPADDITLDGRIMRDQYLGPIQVLTAYVEPVDGQYRGVVMLGVDDPNGEPGDDLQLQGETKPTRVAAARDVLHGPLTGYLDDVYRAMRRHERATQNLSVVPWEHSSLRRWRTEVPAGSATGGPEELLTLCRREVVYRSVLADLYETNEELARRVEFYGDTATPAEDVPCEVNVAFSAMLYKMRTVATTWTPADVLRQAQEQFEADGDDLLGRAEQSHSLADKAARALAQLSV